MKTINQLHREWAGRIMPAVASAVQRQEMERAFHSGALACYRHLIDEVAALPEAEAELAMQALATELEDYFRRLIASRSAEGTDT